MAKQEKMKNLFSTTTGTISNQMILKHYGDCGRFQDTAIDLTNILVPK